MDAEQFWDKLVDKSRNFNEPVHFKKANFGIFSDENIARKLLESLCCFDLEAIRAICRVYVNGEINFKFTRKIHANPPKENESLEEWGCRIFQNKKYGIVINGAEILNDDLAVEMVNFLKPLVRLYSDLQLTSQCIVFIGDYGYTPFGIHYDNPNIRVLHLHQGPGSKMMSLWDKESLFKLTGTRNRSYYYPNKVIQYASNFKIEAGDLFFLPAHYYHIGKTDGFSVGVTLALSKDTVPFVAKKIFDECFGNLLPKLPVNARKDEFMPENVDFLNSILEASNNVKLDELINLAHKNLLLSNLSNCGLLSPPFYNTEVDLTDSQVQILSPFPILYEEIGDNLHLFVRGRSVRIRKSRYGLEVITLLNNKKVLNINTYINEVPADQQSYVLSLLGLIHKYRGVKVNENSKILKR